MKLDLRDIQLRKVLAIAALGMAGFGGVAACASTVPAGAQPRSPASALSRAVPTTHEGAARTIARIAAGNDELAALNNGSGRAVMATCNPGTVSNRPAPPCPLPAGSTTPTDRSGGRQSP